MYIRQLDKIKISIPKYETRYDSFIKQSRLRRKKVNKLFFLYINFVIDNIDFVATLSTFSVSSLSQNWVDWFWSTQLRLNYV